MNIGKMTFLFAFMMVVSGCGPRVMDDFHRAGEDICRELTVELRGIDHIEELLEKEGSLEKKFQKLVDLMIAAKIASGKRGGALAVSEGPYSQKLRKELTRIYEIEGASEIIERAQKEPLIRLGAFDP
ncbi:MAG: hypothetical protein K940chlam2_00213 [Chlamydiae bacterium]|nr:hypothetical protein [Chlamydiota bacterium]